MGLKKTLAFNVLPYNFSQQRMTSMFVFLNTLDFDLWKCFIVPFYFKNIGCF